jgi:hypothetical protein
MVVRSGACVAAHFGSAASETAVCLKTVGIADRSDRTTFELRGSPGDIDVALDALSALVGLAWWARTTPESAIVRCERAAESRCAAAIATAGDRVAVHPSDCYAAIDVVGPLAEDLLHAAALWNLAAEPALLRAGRDSFEVMVAAEAAEQVWARLIDAGRPFGVACVGLDALDHLAASYRVGLSA